MTATTRVRDTSHAGYTPTKMQYGMKANTLIKEGWIVCLDASANATYGGDSGALNAVGCAIATVSNLTSSSLGGAAGAESIPVDFGVHRLLYTGTAPTPGAVVFVVDNQTVSTDSSSGTRGIAGQVIQVDAAETACWVAMGPHVAGMIVIGADVAADVATLQGDVDDLQATAVVKKRVNIPLAAWTNGGGLLVAFADGSANGLTLLDSEALAIRINPSGDLTLPTLITSCPLPLDIDLGEDLELHVSACRIGASDTALVLGGKGYLQTVGAAYDADDDEIVTDSAALDSATKVAKELVLTFPSADLPADADASVTIHVTPSAALDADDLCILSTWLEYTPAITSA